MMTAQAETLDEFAPERFFARAAARLAHEAPTGAARVLEKRLNPDLELPAGLAFRDAAVLVPVVARRPQASVLLTLRTPHLRAHAGQIAFPGGKIDPADAGPAEAAMREAAEEIGLARAMIDPVGYLDPVLTATGYRIVPVLARVDPDHRLSPNPDEVDAVFEVPLAFLMTPENHRQGSRVWNGRMRYFYEMPFEGHHIWGITAGIIRDVYERVFG